MITRTASGTIFRTAFPGTALPSGLTGITTGSGAVTISGDTCIIDSNSNRAFVVPNDSLPSDKIWVVRTKYTRNLTLRNTALVIGASAVQPDDSSDSRDYTWNNRAFFTLGQFGQNEWHSAFWGGGSEEQILYENNLVSPNYVLEATSDNINLVIQGRRGNDFVKIYNTLTYAWGSAQLPNPPNPLWVIIGGFYDAGFADTDIVFYSFEIFKSHNVSMTGLDTGNAVRIYDVSDDSVLAEAVESGGVATLDCEDVDWIGLTCYIKVFEDDSYTVELDVSDNITDPSGGDEYEFINVPCPTVISVNPDNWANTMAIDIDITGTLFATGAVVKFQLAGENDITATDVVVVSDTHITCNIDLDGAVIDDWNVRVTNLDTGYGILVEGFQVRAPINPIVTAIIPTSGYDDGSGYYPVTIIGSGFIVMDGASVKLKKTGETDLIGQEVVVDSETQITCFFDLTAVTAGLWDVEVTNVDEGVGTLNNGFEVTAKLIITNIDLGIKQRGQSLWT